MTKLYEDYADLYDVAFDWDVSDEVDWLLDRLGADCRTVLEPGCGSGRILAALARRGIDAVGIDRSQAMIEAARRRFQISGVTAGAVLSDITDFHLRRVFDGAVCPINTLTHLSPTKLTRHLVLMSRHLRVGGHYLVQLDLHDYADDPIDARPSQWEITRRGTALRISWGTEELDLSAQRLLQRSRIEILSGERAGEVVEEMHLMTAWTPETWAAVLAGSPFRASAVYDGYREDRPQVEPGRAGRLLWHELTREPETTPQ